MGSPETAENIILRWDSTASDDSRDRMIFSGDRSDIDRYLHAVDQIQLSLSSADDDGDKSNSYSSALQIAMARLEDEFRSILLSHTTATSSSSLSRATSSATTDSQDDNDTDSISGERRLSSLTSTLSLSSFTDSILSSDSVSDLRSIAIRMLASGYLRECVQAYASVRKPELESCLRRLGIEKLTIGEIQRLDWESLETKIRRWISPAKICLRSLFPSEKAIILQIFNNNNNDNNDDSSDFCFIETVKSPALQLLNFAEAVSISRRSPEKLFKILDLFDTLVDLLPDLETLFDSKSAESVRVQAAEIISRLAEAARGILSEFENKVLREPSTVPVPGGTIHPLTRYVMNYINLISDYKATMVELITSRPTTGSVGPDLDFDEVVEEGKPPLSLHLIWIIVILQFNLEGKSKHYKDASLAHLFLMNNDHYIVMKIKGSPELREMIGDDYLKKLTGKYRQAATSYQRSTWVRVLYCLRDEGLHVSGAFSSGVSRSALRERFKAFNATLDEVHRVQASWIVPDNQLREELRIAISELLVPAYRSFLGRFRSHIESGRHPEAYIKYSVEDLEDLALDFFEDCQVSQHSRRRSQS